MAKAAALAANNHNLRRFEYMQEKLLAGIDRRTKSGDNDLDVMSKHHVNTNEDGERTWRF